MSQHQQRAAAAVGAMGGRTARACEGCGRRRARWYCKADDAYLCQGCDASVHSANPLARRHERVRLKTSAPSILKLDPACPSWHHGITRKARTPRPKPGTAAKLEPLVPDLEAMSADENNAEEEQLLYRVPIFDPVLSEFCSPVTGGEGKIDGFGAKLMAQKQQDYRTCAIVADDLVAFLPTDDVDLAEFTADMETLLGRGLEEGVFCMEGLGLADSKAQGGTIDGCSKEGNKQIKLEVKDDFTENGHQMNIEMDVPRETLELNFDCGSPAMCDEAEEQKVMAEPTPTGCGGEASIVTRMTLRLDYDAVINAWSSSCQGSSPWTDGERPQINFDDCWPDYMGGTWGGGGMEGGYGGASAEQVAGGGDGGREARVTRYREKRRTRLFAKKIRYEVRKLNAEKRPRMKGRFVKRPSFPAVAAGAGGPNFNY